MIEIKDQEQFNNINNLIANSPSAGELIRIHDLGNNKAYILSSPILINRDNVFIEGYGASKPIIKSNISTDNKMIQVKDLTGGTVYLEDIQIRNLNLKNNGKTYTIDVMYTGLSYSTGSSSSTYSRYESTTVGSTKICKKGLTIEDCIIDNSSNGIFLSVSHNNIIRNNILKNCSCGIFLGSGSSTNNVYNNVIQNNSYGISISYDSNIIASNVIQNNSNYGINGTTSNTNQITLYKIMGMVYVLVEVVILFHLT